MNDGNWLDALAQGFTPTEPSADMREAARQLYALHCAMTEAGFTPEQAMQVVLQAMAGSSR